MTNRLVFLLDCSGSMHSKVEGLVQAANSLISDLCKTVPPAVEVVIYSFNQFLRKLHKTTLGALNAAGGLREYESDGETALYDAVGTLINRYPEGKTTYVIVSDGRDTASTTYSAETVATEVEFARAHMECRFLYIGQGDDAAEAGQSIGMSQHDMFMTRERQEIAELLSSAQLAASVSQSMAPSLCTSTDGSPDVGLPSRVKRIKLQNPEGFVQGFVPDSQLDE